MTFGEKIKDARKQKKMTQKQLAEILGAAHNSISDWENNKNKPDPDTIELICGTLDITPNYLLGNNNDSISPFDKKLIDNFHNKLDEQGRKTVLYILENEMKRVNDIHQMETKIKNLQMEASAELIPTRIICYCQRLASAGSGEFLFDDIPTDVIKVKDTPEARRADFVIGVNGDSMEPDYYDGEKVFVKKTPDIEVGEVGVFVRRDECYIKECGEGGLISRNTKYPGVEPFSDGIKVVGKVIGKAILINK